MDRSPRAPAFQQEGFTLIEVILAATLLSIMMVLLTGSLRIGAESWESGERRLALASRLFVVENFLRHHIGSLLPVAGSATNGQIQPSFQGNRTRMSYVAPMPEQLEMGGLFRFELYLSAHGDSNDLRMSIEPYSASPQGGKSPAPIDDLVIVDQVDEFSVAYLPQPESSFEQNLNPSAAPAPGQWVESWQDFQLPGMIRIRIAPAGEDPWPTLFITPKARVLR